MQILKDWKDAQALKCQREIPAYLEQDLELIFDTGSFATRTRVMNGASRLMTKDHDTNGSS